MNVVDVAQLTAAHEVRRVLALRPDALTAQSRLFVEEIACWQKRAANVNGETGAITFVQRFDSTLGCVVHFHFPVPDGVFTRADDDGAIVFREGPAPTRADIAAVAARVEKRTRRWLRRRGRLDERAAEERSNEAPALSPLEACMQMSLFGSTYLRLVGDGVHVPIELEDARFRGKGPWVAEASGFNVHAGVTVRAGDREGLERVCRYCARPPFSLERLSLLPDGRIAYLLRKPRRDGATHLVMTPVQFLARISSLIPPPRYPLLRLSGVFAPRSSWRAAVVPSGPGARPGATTTAEAARAQKEEANDDEGGAGRRVTVPRGRRGDVARAAPRRRERRAERPSHQPRGWVVGARSAWFGLVSRRPADDPRRLTPLCHVDLQQQDFGVTAARGLRLDPGLL